MHPDARALKQRYEESAWLFEIPEDVVPYGEERARYFADINIDRATRGLDPLVNDEEAHPELTEQRRKRAAEYWEQQNARRIAYESSLSPRS